MIQPTGDLWEGLEDAPTFERGQFFSPGFQGLVKILRCMVKPTRKSGIQFLAEVEVLQTNRAEDPVGCQRVWFQGMQNRAVALPAIKAFQYAVLGLDGQDKDDAQKCAAVSAASKSLQNYACSEANGLQGFPVNLATLPHTKQDGGPFTLHNWDAFDYQAAGHQPPDLARILAAAAPYANWRPGSQAQAPAPNWGTPRAPGPGFGVPPSFTAPPAAPVWSLPAGGQLSPDGKNYWAPGMPQWVPVPQGPPAAPAQSWAPAPFQAPPAFQPPSFTAPPAAPSPPAQVSPDGAWKLVNNNWVPNR